jgi:hypothetical protein
MEAGRGIAWSRQNGKRCDWWVDPCRRLGGPITSQHLDSPSPQARFDVSSSPVTAPKETPVCAALARDVSKNTRFLVFEVLGCTRESAVVGGGGLVAAINHHVIGIDWRRSRPNAGFAADARLPACRYEVRQQWRQIAKVSHALQVAEAEDTVVTGASRKLPLDKSCS